jgi:hypothetical protein
MRARARAGFVGRGCGANKRRAFRVGAFVGPVIVKACCASILSSSHQNRYELGCFNLHVYKPSVLWTSLQNRR